MDARTRALRFALLALGAAALWAVAARLGGEREAEESPAPGPAIRGEPSEHFPNLRGRAGVSAAASTEAPSADAPEIEDPPADRDAVRWEDEATVTVRAEDDGSPVAGAAVRMLVSWRPEEFRAGVTDASGRVRLDTPDRDAVVWVRAAGFVVEAREVGERYAAPPAAVEVRLARGRPLSGRVVRATDGRPVPDADVYVWNAVSEKEIECAPENYGLLRDGGLATDAEGRFAVAGVPPGVPTTVAARAAGLGLAVVRLPATDATREVVLPLGGGGTLRGLVSLDGNGPAPGVRVFAVTAGDESRLRHPDACWLASGDVRLSAFARTDPSGRYRIEGLPVPGRYVAVAVGEERAQGASVPAVLADPGDEAVRDVPLVTPAWPDVRAFAPDGSPVPLTDCDLATLDGAPLDDPFFSGSSSYTSGSNAYSLHTRPPGRWLLLARGAPPWATARVPIELRPGEHRTFDVTLQPGSSVEGVVVDGSGRPVPDARVASGRRTTYRHASTDETGRFRLEGLSAGDLTVEVEAPDGWSEPTSVRTECPSTAVLRVVLASRPEVVGRFEVPRGSSPEVLARLRTGGSVRVVRPEIDADGSFRLPHVPNGEPFDLTFWCREQGAPRRLRGLVAAAGTRLDLGVVRLGPGRSVEGRVVDEGGAPLPSVLVEPDESVRTQVCRTDRAGRFRLEGAPDGPFSVVVRPPGRAAVVATVGSEDSSTLRCPIGASLRGRLTGAPDDLLAGRRLRFVPRSPPGSPPEAPLHETDTDSVGAFEIRLAPGAYDVFTVVRGGEVRNHRGLTTLDRLDARVGGVEVDPAGAEAVLALPGS